MSTALTKLVAISLVAYTRCDYREVIEVPADFTSEQLDQLVNQRYRDVDGGDYVDDPHYWERGEMTHEAPEAGEEACKRLVQVDGKFIVQSIAGEGEEASC